MNKFDCVIIGAGLAGSFCAYSLSKSGLSCLVLDSETIAAGASGNQLGGLMPYVTHPSFVAHDLYNLGFELTSSIIKDNLTELPTAYFSKAAQFPSNERPKKLFADNKFDNQLGLVASIDEAEQLMGIKPSSLVFIYNKTAVVSPPQLCKLLIKKSLSTVIEHSEVLQFNRHDCGFEIVAKGNTYSASKVVICNAYDCTIFPECSFYPVKKVRGQVVSLVPSGELCNVKIPLGYNGYFLPSLSADKSILGTTYDYSFLSNQPCGDRNQKMLDVLRNWVPTCGEQQLDIDQTRVSFRTVSKDRLPIAGQISKDVYISVAHGSRGLHSAGICADYITNLINNLPTIPTVAAAIDPMRKTLN